MNDNNKMAGKVFAWFRSSGVVRGDDRWAAGVCSGIAARLGWSPTLVRALMIVFTFLFGFGAALYAFAWLLLPDARDGRILAEELIAGRWDWNCLGAFALLAVAVLMVGAGWVAIGAAAVALWAICQKSVRQQHGYGYGYRRQGPGGPYTPNMPGGPNVSGGSGVSGGPNAPGGPCASGNPGVPGGPSGPYGAPAAPYSGPVAANGTPGGGPLPPYAGPVPPFGANNPAGSAGPIGSAGPAAPQPFPMTAGPAYAAMPEPSPAPAAAPVPRRARRKPAGPFLVLLVIGITLISGAGVAWNVDGAYFGGGMGIVTTVTAMTIWIGAVCVAMGVLLIILGAIGRRAGGLIPLALVAGFTACCMILATASIGYVNRDMNTSRDGYAEVSLSALTGDHESENANGTISLQARIDKNSTVDYFSEPYGIDSGVNPNMTYWVSDSSPQTFRRLEQGVHFRGDDYDMSIANIDLSKYANWGYDGEQANKYKSGCPAGQINLSVDNAHVYVTLPDGCPYAFGSGGFVFSQSDNLGGYGSLVRSNGEVVQVPFAGHEYRDDSMMKSDAYDPSNYDWQGNGVTDESSFLVNYVSGVSGKVTVRYASETLLPSYTEFVRQVAKNDLASVELTTKRHYEVQNGDTSAPGAGTDDAGTSQNSSRNDKKEHSDD